jgi:hypothetical protein
VPSLRVRWVSIAEVEAGRYPLDPQIAPVFQSALDALRAQMQRDPVVALRYLADMASMRTAPVDHVWWARDGQNFAERQTLPLEALRAPEPGDGILTLAEAALLYKAFLPDDEQMDLSNLRRRFLTTESLTPLNEQRPVRGRELDWRRVSKAYRFQEKEKTI